MALADKYYTIGVLGKSFGVIELMAHQAKWELRDPVSYTHLTLPTKA